MSHSFVYQGDRSSGDPKPLGGLIELVISRMGISHKIAQYRACALWPEVVGVDVARVTTVEGIEQGKLFVRVTTPTWRAELSFLKRRILDKVNKAVGEDILEDIIFK